MPSKRLFMNKLNFDEIKTPFSFITVSYTHLTLPTNSLV